MADDNEKYRKQLERIAAQKRELTRKERVIGGKMTKSSRELERERKIQMGAWVQARGEAYYPGITERMMEDFRTFYIVTDYHRALFDIPPLPEDERKIRLANMAETRKRKAKPKDDKPDGGK